MRLVSVLGIQGHEGAFVSKGKAKLAGIQFPSMFSGVTVMKQIICSHWVRLRAFLSHGCHHKQV